MQRAADASDRTAIDWLALLALFDAFWLLIGLLVAAFLCTGAFFGSPSSSLFAWHLAHVAIVASALFVCVARRLYVPAWLVGVVTVLFVVDLIVIGRRVALIDSLADTCDVALFVGDLGFVVLDVLYFAAVVVSLRFYDLFGYRWQVEPPKQDVYL